MTETFNEQKDKIWHMTKMKDGAFIKIGELKYRVNDFEEKFDNDQIMNEKFQRQNKDNINNITQQVKEQHKTQRNILSKLQDHDLTLNSTGKYSPLTPYQLISNSEKYPILKSAASTNTHFFISQKCLTRSHSKPITLHQLCIFTIV